MKGKRQNREASPAVDLMALAECIEHFEDKRVVVLGDFVADSFQIGDITRVSREAPVLILRHRQTEIVPGGGANAANNFAALGASVIPISVVGDDAAGENLIAQFRAKNLNVSGILRVKDKITPTKTRFLAGWTHTVAQQVLRVDYEPTAPLSESHFRKLQSLAAAKIKSADALAISDYGFGVVTPQMVRNLTSSLKRPIPVGLDSRYQLTAYRRAGITAATPNEAELEALHHISIGRDKSALERCGHATLQHLKLGSLLVTRGKDGMALFEPGQPTVHIPVHGSDQAVDVTGAGDTVLAAYTLALASGASAIEAAHIANIAGGLVVMKRGTATVTRGELLGAIRAAASETTS